MNRQTHEYQGYEIEETIRGCNILKGPKLCFKTNNLETAKLWIDWNLEAKKNEQKNQAS